MTYSQKTNAGFTLVEIAVVLVIVGILVGSFIGTFSERIDKTKIDNTKQQLNDIKKLLKAYAYSGNAEPYLPCPDTSTPPDGSEDRTNGVCNAGNTVGILPYETLGMGNSDAWGMRYRYWVSSNYSTNTSDTGLSLTTPDTGATINTRVGDATRKIVKNAVVVIFSHGKNNLGATSTDGINQPSIPSFGNGHDDEIENIDTNATFMSRPPSVEGSAAVGGIYDDILVWMGSFELKAAMVEAGKLP